jgi:ubiquinone/menaquinone biosynthesis C-methylase UbiE
MTHAERRFDPVKLKRLIGLDRWNRWNPPHLLETAGVAAGQHVLDLGSGPGFWTLPIAERVGTQGLVTALDVSPIMLEALSEQSPPSHVYTLQSELPKIALPDNSVDFIWAAFVFHEVDEHVALAEEMRRVLRPEGRLAVLDWRPDATGEEGPPRHDRLSTEQVIGDLELGKFGAAVPVWSDSDAYLIIAS